jgi:hypothetical protein
MPRPDDDGGRADHEVSAAALWQYVTDAQSKVTLPSDSSGHHVTEADVQKLLSGMIASVMSKVNPNPEAPVKTSVSDSGTPANHLPLGGGASDPLDPVPLTQPGGTMRGPKPSVGPGVPGGPQG